MAVLLSHDRVKNPQTLVSTPSPTTVFKLRGNPSPVYAPGNSGSAHPTGTADGREQVRWKNGSQMREKGGINSKPGKKEISTFEREEVKGRDDSCQRTRKGQENEIQIRKL